ncbi:MAG: FAD-dependent oxidoreductase [Candidatus Marinimicrobia bacterium]|nr:FAD-dependent oxidoreductase [Candidatus Neomarinimicrobiota bacterium]
MGYKTLQIKLPTNYSDDYIRKAIQTQFGLRDFSFQIEKKSLDARKKNDIHWLVNFIATSPALKGESYVPPPSLEIPYKKRKESVAVIGSGPAGFFSAHVLQKAGFSVTIIERGSEVKARTIAINDLEKNGVFSASNNYAFGEGGAGTFSDGKLTSRSKHISRERQFILSEYVKAGAPKEILYMAHPHLGTDNLKLIVANLRKTFLENGGTIQFDTHMTDIHIKNGHVTGLVCDSGDISADHVLIAAGHSAYDTYRMLMRRGVPFHTKQFAIGHRIEHPRTLINQAQWGGREELPGVKAAEYRLATKTASGLPVYTFCMCPGGHVVQSAAFPEKSIVNGMSYYQRNGQYSNAACVAGVHPDTLLGHTCTPTEILDWMDALEEKFYTYSKDYSIPATRATDYTKKRKSGKRLESSYSLGLFSAALYNMIPEVVSKALIQGLKDFNGKLAGFDQGILMGLESKTSSPLQADREKNGRSQGIDNLYIIGEASGYAGGIISSAADGVRCAMALAGN